MQLFGKRKKRLGLALGSGGAKGFAHIGVLQALTEGGIAFDVVAGTSAGSLIGALYARGYSPLDMLELVRQFDYKSMALSVLMAGSVSPVKNRVDMILGESDFSDLKKPFIAVATDVSNGTEVRLREGNVAQSVLASCAMPPFFRSVSLNGKFLADGAFCNAVPGDAAKELGADYVVGIALSEAESYRETLLVNSSGKTFRNEQTGFLQCDFLIEPPLNKYTAVDVLSAAQMYDIGYDCGREQLEKLRKALKGSAILR